jgi:hypothetical protein
MKARKLIDEAVQPPSLDALRQERDDIKAWISDHFHLKSDPETFTKNERRLRELETQINELRARTRGVNSPGEEGERAGRLENSLHSMGLKELKQLIHQWEGERGRTEQLAMARAILKERGTIGEAEEPPRKTLKLSGKMRVIPFGEGNYHVYTAYYEKADVVWQGFYLQGDGLESHYNEDGFAEYGHERICDLEDWDEGDAALEEYERLEPELHGELPFNVQEAAEYIMKQDGSKYPVVDL